MSAALHTEIARLRYQLAHARTELERLRRDTGSGCGCGRDSVTAAWAAADRQRDRAERLAGELDQCRAARAVLTDRLDRLTTRSRGRALLNLMTRRSLP